MDFILLGMFIVFMAMGLKFAVVFLNDTLEAQENKYCEGQHTWITTEVGLKCAVCPKRPADDIATKQDFEIEE